jgi:hypothetical protein
MVRGYLGKLSLISAVLVLQDTAAATSIDPSANWLQPWQVTFNPIVTSSGLGASAFANRDFGPKGDGEDLPGVHGAAFSIARADSGLFGSASAATGVGFTRQFQLSGSPDGWNVGVDGRLVGLLLTIGSSTPKATVVASAMVAPCPAINFGSTTLAPNRIREVDQMMSGTCMLPDGTYIVQGALSTTASISLALLSPPGTASADFFSAPVGASRRGLFVDVTASPIPEPFALPLLGLGAMLFMVDGRIRRAYSRVIPVLRTGLSRTRCCAINADTGMQRRVERLSESCRQA